MKGLVIVVFSLIILVPVNQFVLADEHTPCNAPFEPNDEKGTPDPDEYLIEILLLDVGDFDLKSGTYEMDFRVTMFANSIGMNFTEHPPPKIDFINGKINSIDGEFCDDFTYRYKVNGNFINDFDLRAFPFANADLKIVLEPEPTAEFESVKFTFDPEKTESIQLANVTGWKPGKAFYESSVYAYPEGSGSYFRFVATYPFTSFPEQSFLKVIFPIMLLPGLAILSFWMDPKNISDRIALSVGSLITAVFFNATYITGELPQLSYLTFADKIIIVAYVLFLYCILTSVVLKRLLDDKEEERVCRLNSKLRMALPVIILAAFIPLLFRIEPISLCPGSDSQYLPPLAIMVIVV